MADTRLFLLFIFAFLINTSYSTDPCTSYANLNDPVRSTAYLRGSAAICDSTITEQWYRSVSGAGPDMPTQAVPFGRCGTQYPVWVDDSHGLIINVNHTIKKLKGSEIVNSFPLPNQEKDVKVCISHIFSHCHEDFKIKMKNCGNYNVYRLIQTSGCPVAYCFGTELQCPDGQSSDNGFTPGCEDVPTIPLSLSVTPGLEQYYRQPVQAPQTQYLVRALKFDCNLGSIPANHTDLLFEVKWYIENSEITSFENMTYEELVNTSLSEKTWIAKNIKMGFNVKCKMRVKYRTGRVYGPSNESDFIFAGFQAEKKSVLVVEDEEVKIKVSLTVPIGCVEDENGNRIECYVRISLREPEYQQKKCEHGVDTSGGIVFKNLNCGLQFYYPDWTTPQEISVTGKRDSLYNSDNRITFIRLVAEQSFSSVAWSGATIPDIRVNVVDKDIVTLNRQCQSSNDPHMLTFDGIHYENQRAGEFVLYKHYRLPISVHAMYTQCPGRWWTINRATCNCGVVVRNDDALFTANFCGKITTGTNNDNSVSSNQNQYMERINCDDKYMTIVDDGQKYTITLPTGTVVIFGYGTVDGGGGTTFGIHYINVKPSVEDIKSSTGLCGYFDGNQGNDFRLRNNNTAANADIFSEDWRVPVSESLFALNLDLQPADVNLRQYCVCRVNSTSTSVLDSSQIKCNLDAAMETCLSTTIAPGKAEGFFSQCEGGRFRRSIFEKYIYSQNHLIRKRSTDTNEDGIAKYELTYDPDYKDPPIEPQWGNGWDETKARDYCSEHIEKSRLFLLCNDSVPNYGDDISRTVDDCVNDIKLSGSTSFLEASIEALKTSCLTEATRLENLTKSASSSGNESKSLLDDILDISCIDNCSGNGTCVAGKCNCFTGYEGSKCNLKKSQPPVISQHSNPGYCKTNLAPCKTYFIAGNGFVYGSIKCRARPFKVFQNGRIEETGNNFTFDGTYINEISCSCSIPDSRRRRSADASTVIANGYYMSVANDGITYSGEITFINYDSSCYSCDVSGTTCTELASCNDTTTTSISTAQSTATNPISTQNTATSDPVTETSSIQNLATGDLTTVTTSGTSGASTSHNNIKKKKDKDDEGQSDIGIIVAVVIAVIALVMLVVIVGVFIMKKKLKLKSCVDTSTIDVRGDKVHRSRFNNHDYEHLESRSSSVASFENSNYEKLNIPPLSTKATSSRRPGTPGAVSIQLNDNVSYVASTSTVDLFAANKH